MYQIAFYTAGRRVQKNFRNKSKAKRVADQILRGLTVDTETVDSLVTPDLESLIAARKALSRLQFLHVACGCIQAFSQGILTNTYCPT